MSEPPVPILSLPVVTSVASAAWVPIVQNGVTSRVQVSTLAPLGFVSLPVAITEGGTGATDATQARLNLGLGTAAVQNIGTSGAAVPLLNAANTWLTTQTFTVAPVFTDAAATRTALGLGTAAVQNIGTSGANVPLLSTANTWTLAQTFTAAPVFSDQSGTRTALGLGTAATQNTGTSGTNVPLLDGVNTWSGAQTFPNISITGVVGTSAITVTGVTQTVSRPILNLAQTWNAGGVTFTAALINVTNTASAAGSLLLDLQAASASIFSVSVAGRVDSAQFVASGLVRTSTFQFASARGSFSAPADGIFAAVDNAGTSGSAFSMLERADPTAPAANIGLLYVRDNGAGKTQLAIRFPTGAVQVIATEP